jgi:DNA-binding transcriptional regulator YhcF (GntR family)
MFIKKYLDENEIPPSCQDVAKYLKCNTNNITHHYKILEENGFINKKEKISRGVSLTERSKNLL